MVKTIYRVRLSSKAKSDSQFIEGIRLQKNKWHIVNGGDPATFKTFENIVDVEQTFTDEKGQLQFKATTKEPLKEPPAVLPEFKSMTAEALKNYFAEKGILVNEYSNLTKEALREKAKELFGNK